MKFTIKPRTVQGVFAIFVRNEKEAIDVFRRCREAGMTVDIFAENGRPIALEELLELEMMSRADDE